MFYWNANILKLKKVAKIVIMTATTISKRWANLDYILPRTSRGTI